MAKIAQFKVEYQQECKIEVKDLAKRLKNAEILLEETLEENKAKDLRIQQLEQSVCVPEDSFSGEKSQAYYYENQVFSFQQNYDIDYSSPKGKNSVKVLSKWQLPNLKMFKMDALKANSESIKDLFNNSCPESLEILTLNHKVFSRDPIDISYYAEALEKWCKITTKEIYLENFVLNSEQLSNIVKSSADCNSLVFRACTILVDEHLDFGNSIDYNIKILSFYNWGHKARSDWNGEKTQISNILRAIKASKLNQSLIDIWVYTTDGVLNSLKTAKKWFKKAGISSKINAIKGWEPASEQTF